MKRERIVRTMSYILTQFARITTLICVVAATYVSCFWGSNARVHISIIWEILIVSALCTFGTCIVKKREYSEYSKMEMLVRMIFNFVYVNAVVLLSGFAFEWFYLSEWKMIVALEVGIVFVFLVLKLFFFWSDVKEVNLLNARLKEREK